MQFFILELYGSAKLTTALSSALPVERDLVAGDEVEGLLLHDLLGQRLLRRAQPHRVAALAEAGHDLGLVGRELVVAGVERLALVHVQPADHVEVDGPAVGPTLEDIRT